MLVLIIEVFVCIFKVKLVLRKIKEREKKKNEGDNIWKFWKLIKEVFFLFLLWVSVF